MRRLEDRESSVRRIFASGLVCYDISGFSEGVSENGTKSENGLNTISGFDMIY